MPTESSRDDGSNIRNEVVACVVPRTTFPDVRLLNDGETKASQELRLLRNMKVDTKQRFILGTFAQEL